MNVPELLKRSIFGCGEPNGVAPYRKKSLHEGDFW